MEQFPPGGWDLDRPNLVSWTNELGQLPASTSLNNARDRLFTLGRKVDGLTRVITHDTTYDELEDAQPPKSRRKRAPVAEPLFMENHQTASIRSFFVSNGPS